MKLCCQGIQGCGQECRSKVYDYSFGHAYGTEEVFVILSDCCEAPVVDEFGKELSEPELLSIKEWNEV